MDRSGLIAPTLDHFEAIARRAWDELPEGFRALAGDVVFRIEDFADEEVLKDLDLEDPFELTGLYQGVGLTQRSVMDPSPHVPMVFLYRRPILEEWIESRGLALDELIAHVLVHEVGHHFGLSDEEMDAILDATP